MRNFITILIFMLLPHLLYAQGGDLHTMFTRLDQALDSVEYYRQAKEQRIEHLEQLINNNADVAQERALNLALYTELAKYDSNAAFELVSENIERYQAEGDKLAYAKWSINKAYLYTASGLLKEAADVLQDIRPMISRRQILLEYYRQMEYLQSHMRQYTLDDERISPLYLERREAYTDSVAMVIRPKDQYYLVNKGWQQQHNLTDSAAYYCRKLEKRIQSPQENDIDRAMDAYTVAHIYYLADNSEKFIEYLIISAIADVKSCNHDIASLQELAQVMLLEGNIDRAYRYLSYALEHARKFGDRVRVMEIATLLDATYGQLLAKNRAQSKNLARFSALLILSLLVVAVSLYSWIRKNRRLRLTLENLDEANCKLEKANKELFGAYAELKTLNDSLIESNFIKESYIGNTFDVCSTHITKMEKIFVKITNLVRNNKLEELKRYCDSSLLLNAELKVMYQAFDYTFLKMYPTFIEQINCLMLPDKQFKLRDDESLNTELRIFALNRLGISDNQKIASILHCSLQTVYNNYQKSKNRTELSNKELLQEVMKIN